MATKSHRDMGVHIDNASASLTDISTYVNQQELARAIAMLDDSGMGQEETTYLPGMGGTTIGLNGQWNTTTDAIYGPLVSDNTGISKTIAFKSYATRFYKGEVWVNNFRLSGSRDTLQTWSADHTFTGAVTRTSVVGS